jgi:hypothetical protein
LDVVTDGRDVDMDVVCATVVINEDEGVCVVVCGSAEVDGGDEVCSLTEVVGELVVDVNKSDEVEYFADTVVSSNVVDNAV